jgi:hypothetical protein
MVTPILGKYYNIDSEQELYEYKGEKKVCVEYDETFDEDLFDCYNDECKDSNARTMTCYEFYNSDFSETKFITDLSTLTEVEEKKNEVFPSITEEEFKCEWEREPNLRRAIIDIYLTEQKKYVNTESSFRQVLRQFGQAGTSIGGNVKSGVFTSKFAGYASDGNPLVDYEACNELVKWYVIADVLRSNVGITVDNGNWCFYRALGLPLSPVGNNFIQPIPASYTTSYNFVKNWMTIKGGSCCIFKVYVPMGTSMTFLDEHNDSGHLTAGQSEVTLPAGIVRIFGRNTINGITHLTGIFQAWDIGYCISYLEQYNITGSCSKFISNYHKYKNGLISNLTTGSSSDSYLPSSKKRRI